MPCAQSRALAVSILGRPVVRQRNAFSRDVLRAILRTFFLSPIVIGRRPTQKNIAVHNMNKEKGMFELLVLLAVVAVWVLLQAYVLPKFGIST